MGIGRHLLADFYGIEAGRLKDAAGLRRCLEEGAEAARMTPLAPPKLHVFEGGGVTGYLLLAESHIALHTYPELGYAAVDVFSCGEAARPEAALDVFRRALAPEIEDVRESSRGHLLTAR